MTIKEKNNISEILERIASENIFKEDLELSMDESAIVDMENHPYTPSTTPSIESERTTEMGI